MSRKTRLLADDAVAYSVHAYAKGMMIFAMIEWTSGEKAISSLETVARSNPAPKDAAICHTGLGRCRFRLGQFDSAMASFKKALELGAGGPFHRAWVYLRMGNIADLAKDRKRAIDYYKQSVTQGRKYQQARRAEKYLDKPYRGYKVDG